MLILRFSIVQCGHIFSPEGKRPPKDGPSAGITMLTSLCRCLPRKRSKRGLGYGRGEITFTRQSAPSGSKGKDILAAKRCKKLRSIITCEDNRKDYIGNKKRTN